MKVLIWFLCFLLYVLVDILIKRNGVVLAGAIPNGLLYGLLCGLLFGTLMIWIPKKLCRMWDEYLEEKESLDTQKETNKTMEQEQTATPGHDQWLCTCGKLHYRYESSCVCGKSRIEILLAKAPTNIVSEEKTASKEIGEQTSDTISFCRKCGCKLPDGATFCGQCGTQITEE